MSERTDTERWDWAQEFLMGATPMTDSAGRRAWWIIFYGDDEQIDSRDMPEPADIRQAIDAAMDAEEVPDGG